MKIIIVFLALLASAHAQLLAMGKQQVAVVTPGLVNLHAGSSTGSNAMGARVAGTVTCVANAYCTSLPAASVSGNTIAVAYSYTSTNTTAHAPTVTDDKGGGSSTYTCVTEQNDASGTTRTFAGWCYSFSVAASIRVITVTWPVATMTHGQAAAFQFYNLVTGDTLSSGNGTQTPNTTYTSGAITTTIDGDLVCNLVVGTNTRRNLGTGFTAGSGFSLYVAERLDAFAVECGIQSTHGSITPTMTGLSNDYVAADISFKAGTSGTAPSGMYILAEQHETTDSGTTGPFTVQMPSAGANLLVSANQCGGATTPLTPTGITDSSSNTWKKTSIADVTNTGFGNGGLGNTFYAANVTGAATNTLTVATSLTGDCSFWLYSIAGAATAPWTGHVDECVGALSTQTECADGNNTGATNGSTFSPFSVNFPVGFFPGNSAGIVIGTMGIGFNTVISASAPTGELFDSDTSGGENLSGPWPVDQNNGDSHVANSDNSAQTVTYGLTTSGTNISTYWGVRDGFAASTATKYPSSPLQVKVCKATASGTTLASCSITPMATGHTLVIMTADATSSAHTITLTDSASNTIVQQSGNTSATLITSTGGMKAWWILSANGTSADTFTFTWSTANTYRVAYIVELANVTAADFTNIASVTVAGGAGGFLGTSTGTLTSAHEVVLGWNICNGSCSLPTSGVNLLAWDSLANGTYDGQYAEWFAVNATTAVQTSFVDPGKTNGTNEGAGTLTFK